MGKYQELFKFAAKAGSLEGYMYQREKLEPLSNWVSNLDSMYRNLPDEVKEDIREEYNSILTKVLLYGEKVLEEEIRSKLNRMAAELKK
ncbi:hypothetical protein ACFLVX_03175 [Chloroflexota bacterium]